MTARCPIPEGQSMLPVPKPVERFFALVDLANMTDLDRRWLDNLVDGYRPLPEEYQEMLREAQP